VSGDPTPRQGVLFHGVPGDFRTDTLTPNDLQHVGAFRAQLHCHADQFVASPPPPYAAGPVLCCAHVARRTGQRGDPLLRRGVGRVCGSSATGAHDHPGVRRKPRRLWVYPCGPAPIDLCVSRLGALRSVLTCSWRRGSWSWSRGYSVGLSQATEHGDRDMSNKPWDGGCVSANGGKRRPCQTVPGGHLTNRCSRWPPAYASASSSG
jgi:hypothetical protein